MNKPQAFGKLGLMKMAWIVFVFSAATTLTATAQTFNTLSSFDVTDGDDPYYGRLVQGFDGNLYGTTSGGGANDNGTVFKITPSGTLTTLYSFCSQSGCTDGAFPAVGLALGIDGNFYGTTEDGGTNSYGTVFKITPSGTLTTLHSFDFTDGVHPLGQLVQATNEDFYGTTYIGGANADGTVFKITPSGTLTTLYSFCSQSACADGQYPQAGLVQATNGNFYGTTYAGGTDAAGTVFEITPAGKLTTLHSFDCTDGSGAMAGLVQATNGNFYGTTYACGSYDYGVVFKITPSGTLTVLHSFDTTNGEAPVAGLVQATNGNFYGTTVAGGADNEGTVFEITPAGKLTTLHSFCPQSGCTDGASPYAGLTQSTNGTFYATTNGGGADGDGTVFSLSVGLGPFVETLFTSGKVGANVIVLGNNLTGTTSVSFNGTAATFKVVSTTEITTTVPTGATTGTVEVTTPSGTLDSNVEFRLTPQITSFSPTSGAVGTIVTITGVSLTQTTSVTFGGVKAASFTVNSDTQVMATVPTGAKTGKVGITTPGGTAASATSFTVN